MSGAVRPLRSGARRPDAVAATLVAVALLGSAGGASGQPTPASAASPAKRELVQKVLQIQRAEIEGVTRNVVERPAGQMMQEAGLAMQRQVPPEKREAMAKAIEAEVRKYVDEAYPLARERALRIAPQTIGAMLEEKMSEDELRQLVTWLESPVYRKFQQIGPDMRNAFIRRLLQDAQPVVDPKVQALDGRIRAILGVPPAVPATPGSAPVRTPSSAAPKNAPR